MLSLEGRDLAAERWYDGSHGPDVPAGPGRARRRCETCGFLVRLAGPLSQVFGVCANAQANDDGRVVSWDHGCGAHSEAQLAKKSQPQPLPEPVLDTLVVGRARDSSEPQCRRQPARGPAGGCCAGGSSPSR